MCFFVLNRKMRAECSTWRSAIVATFAACGGMFNSRWR